MNATILDFAIIAVPLIIVITVLVSRFRERLKQQEDEVNELRRTILGKHIRTIHMRVGKNVGSRSSSLGATERQREGILIRA